MPCLLLLTISFQLRDLDSYTTIIEFHQRNAASTVIVLALALYTALVYFLRYKRSEAMCSTFGQNRDLSTMTVAQEANEIIAQLQRLEFLFAFNKARTIALLKVRRICLNITENPYNKQLTAAGGRHLINAQIVRGHRTEQSQERRKTSSRYADTPQRVA